MSPDVSPDVSPDAAVRALHAAVRAVGRARAVGRDVDRDADRDADRDGGWEGGPAPRLIRHGSNAVFALGPVVARVGPGDPRSADSARRALAVARWLAEADFPAVRAVADDELAVPQPVAAEGRLITFWHSLGDDVPHGSTGDLGRLLRRFHGLALPGHLRPTPMDPVGRITRQLAGDVPLRAADRAFLATRLDDVAGRYARLTPRLRPGHLHGDATVANVVLDRRGRATLVDLDLIRTGPREWDLLRTAVYAHRLGWHTPAEYRQFCAAYGWDVAASPDFGDLADLTELLQVAWLADAATERPHLVPELAARVADLRDDRPGDPGRRHWNRV